MDGYFWNFQIPFYRSVRVTVQVPENRTAQYNMCASNSELIITPNQLFFLPSTINSKAGAEKYTCGFAACTLLLVPIA
jgi:hypothetical protein